MSEVHITIPPGKWVEIPELGVEVRHDEVVSKFIYYDVDDDKMIFRETPWQVRKQVNDGSEETPSSS